MALNTPGRMAAAMGFGRSTLILNPVIAQPPAIGIYPLFGFGPVTPAPDPEFAGPALDYQSVIHPFISGDSPITKFISRASRISPILSRLSRLRNRNIDG